MSSWSKIETKPQLSYWQTISPSKKLKRPLQQLGPEVFYPVGNDDAGTPSIGIEGEVNVTEF